MLASSIHKFKPSNLCNIPILYIASNRGMIWPSHKHSAA
nr:MAG TPA: hypothetical protein [Caudoviricetes sp.]